MTAWINEFKSPIDYLLLESSDFILLESGDQIILEQTGSSQGNVWTNTTKN